MIRMASLFTILAVAGGSTTVALGLQVDRPGDRATGVAAAVADSLVGVFEGRTPCGAEFVEFTGYQGTACEKMKWRLTLYRNADGSPGRYVFDGTRVTRRGRWAITRGAAGQPAAIVYRLETDLPPNWIALLRADDNVLLLLDHELRLMVGDASWSYTLSRTK
jgi:hypothetical protein